MQYAMHEGRNKTLKKRIKHTINQVKFVFLRQENRNTQYKIGSLRFWARRAHSTFEPTTKSVLTFRSARKKRWPMLQRSQHRLSNWKITHKEHLHLNRPMTDERFSFFFLSFFFTLLFFVFFFSFRFVYDFSVQLFFYYSGFCSFWRFQNKATSDGCCCRFSSVIRLLQSMIMRK